MRLRALSTFAVIAVAASALVVGCAQKRAQPVAKTAAPTQAATTLPPPPPSAEDEAAAGQVKRPRLGEAGVYVDGRSVGVLRNPELPSSLKARVVNLGEGYEAKRYSFTEYARSLGVDPAKVKGLHLYGGSRIVVVDQAEFARVGAKISFSFSQGDRGKPRVHWPAEKIRVNSTIDMLSGVVFYVDKTPPHLVDGELVMPDGSKVEGKVPYAPAEQGNGTRVYVDGALVGTVKRKKLTDDLIAPGAAGETSKFSLTAYAAKLGADVKQVKAIDMLAGDDVVAHLAPDAARSATFHVPARNQGQILVDLPAGEGKRAARISAVQIFVKSTPPSREVTSLDDAPSAQPNAGGAGGGGGRDSDDE